MNNYTGKVRGIKFLVKDSSTIRVWKPVDLDMAEFKPQCDFIVKYLIDEGFFNKKSCRVEVVP